MDIKNKSVLVTGGAGFIGSHVVDSLIKEHPEKIVVLDNFYLGKRSNLDDARNNFGGLIIEESDLTNYKELKRVVNGHGIDIVYNLAVIPLPTSLVKPEWTFKSNVMMTLNLCKLQRDGKFRKLVQFSSSEACGSAIQVPMTEDHPLNPETSYAASKAATDHLALSYGRTFGMDVVVIRPFNNYGPRQNSGKYAGIVPLTIKRIMKDEPIVIYGDGRQTRDYIYVTDTAEATVEISKRDDMKNLTINIASGEELQILDLVEKITGKMGYTKDFVYKEERPGDIKRHVADISLAKKLINFKPKTMLDEGLKLTIEWFRKNDS